MGNKQSALQHVGGSAGSLVVDYKHFLELLDQGKVESAGAALLQNRKLAKKALNVHGDKAFHVLAAKGNADGIKLLSTYAVEAWMISK